MRNKILTALAVALTLGAATASLSTSALGLGRYLAPRKTPGAIKAAVSEVTKLGRDEGDFFGFQRLEVYDLKESAAEPRLKKILADVIEASRSHGDFTLADYCKDGYDDQGRVLAFDDDNECALWLIGHRKTPRAGEIFATLGAWYSVGSSEQRRMSAAVGKIQSYLKTLVPQAEEISISLDGLNVSEETVVLIDKKAGHVVVMKFDYGA